MTATQEQNMIALDAAMDAASKAWPPNYAQRGHIEAAIRAYLAALASPAQEPVAEAGTMPGTDGFTMACFDAAKVPVGTKLFLAAPPAPAPAQVALKSAGVHASQLVEANIVSGDIDDDTAVMNVEGLIGDISTLLEAAAHPPAAQVGAALPDRLRMAFDRLYAECDLAFANEIGGPIAEALALAEGQAPEGMVLVPREPLPEMIGAWYRVKNGHHFHDEPAPTDTSDYAAYRAMLEAAPAVQP